MGRIVVGVDGSPGSFDALRWAAAHTGPADMLVAISAVEAPPVHWIMPMEGIPMAVPDLPELEVVAGDRLDRWIDEVLGAPPPVKVTTSVAAGSAAAVLIEASKDADMIVVGSRGHGGFRGLLLGSVSHSLTTHAHCPLVILPHTEE